MIKQHKYGSLLIVVLFCFALVSGTDLLAAANAAKQLAKGISLYENNKSDEAMDYFVDVLLNGNQTEIATANKYINLIHNQRGGIVKPVEVDVHFKEGEVKNLDQVADEAVLAVQEQARAAAEQEQAALAAAEAKQREMLGDLADDTAAQRDAILNAADVAAQDDLDLDTAEEGVSDWDPQLAATDAAAVEAQAAAQDEAALLAAQTDPDNWQDDEAAPSVFADEDTATQGPTSVFEDLTAPDAVEARELYTRQKLASMTAAAMDNINATKGAHLYMRDDHPDALDIDPEVIFENGQFRQDSLPLLNSVYELLALTQGSAYVILPPGSYTDDVTLSGIRQAMALNSYLVSRGISQGKLHYNMGLSDQEPPARYANLNGIAIVFDYDAKLPTSLEKNENNETAPLLSMAIVPLCHAIDRSLGEAFAIDFSVLETMSPISNWVLQVVQHGRDGKYYVVRKLEGFSPVYHQILWNGRKGIIGPELPCGKYTVVLTGVDLKGQQQTIRRRLIVKCAGDSAESCTGTCAKKVESGELDYSAARLWTKPGRKMYQTAKVASAPAAAQTGSSVSTTQSQSTKKTTTRTIIQEVDDTEDESAIAPLPGPRVCRRRYARESLSFQ